MELLKKRNVIATLLLALLCFVAGLFFIEKKEAPISASAETITTIDGFRQYGVQMSLRENGLFLKFTINLPQDMTENLSEPTIVSDGWFDKKYYTANVFYLRVTRKQGDNVVYQSLYHIDPEHSDLTAEMLYLEGSNALVYVPMGASTTWTTEYTYVVEYGYYGVNEDFFSERYGSWDFNTIGETYNRSTFSVQSSARKVLNTYDNLTEKEVEVLNIFAGYNTSSEKFTVKLQYKTVVEYGRVETKTEQYLVSSLCIGNPSMVYDEIAKLKGIKQKDDFNAVYVDSNGREREIILQVDGYTYVYDEASQVGTLTITYRQFDYKSFAIRLQDNNTEDDINLYYYIHTTNVSQADNGRIFLKFYYSDIVEQAFEDLGWIFELKKENFSIINNTSGLIRAQAYEEYFMVYFMPADEDDLQNLNVFALTEIIPDYTCNVDLSYTRLFFDGSTIVDIEMEYTTTMMYSEYIKFCNFNAFKESSLYKYAEEALNVVDLGKEQYMIPSTVTSEKTSDGFRLSVGYEYYTLIQITEASGKVFFRAADAASLSYTIAMLGIAPPAGTRIKSLSAASDQPVVIDFKEDEFTKLKVTLNCNTREKRIIPISMEYSNSWYINIVYKDTYKDTPFAVEKEEVFEFTVGQYDPKNFTIENVKKLLGRTDDMKICGIAIPDRKVQTELTSESTYTATVTYGECSLKQIDYNGTSQEIRVPLTSYAAWCKSFGDDMTILYLNTTQETYFDYSNEVDREKLYGFFSVAVFEEQVSDLNYWFRSLTGDGRVVVFEQRETVGSTMYQFFDRLTTKGPLVSVRGYTGMTYCEILNDANHKQHSVFFFMDASDGYISDGGATDKDDTDGAFENKVEEIVGGVQDWIDGVNGSISDSIRFMRILTVALIGVGITAGVAVGVVWLIKYYKKKE